MKRFKLTSAICFFLIAIFLVACNTGGSQTNSMPTDIVLEKGTGGLKGVIANITQFWESGTVYVFAAEFHGNEEGEGVYVLEPSIHPSTTLETGGVFQIGNVPPGEYVLVVGPSPEEATTVRADGKVQVFKVEADKITDVGDVNLEW